MIVVPCWDSSDDDSVLKALAEALLRVMGGLGPQDDVRRFTKDVQLAVHAAVAGTAASKGRVTVTQAAAGGRETVPVNPEELIVLFEDGDDSAEEEEQEHAGLRDHSLRSQLVAA
jgi:hypothetical protein